MSLRSPGYSLLLIVPALLFAVGCDDAKNVTTATAPSGVAPVSSIQSAVSVEPAALRPEFLPGLSCRSNRPFGTRLNFVIGGGRDISLHRLRFRFVDRFGVIALPDVAPQTGIFPMTSPPVSIPTSSPIPIPGLAPMPPDGVFIPFGASRTLPFFLTFGCGASSTGTLFVMFDAKFDNTMQSSELRVRVQE